MRFLLAAALAGLILTASSAPASAQSAGSERSCGAVTVGQWKARAYSWGPQAPSCASTRTIARRALRNAGRDYTQVRRAGSWRCTFYTDAGGAAIGCGRPGGGGGVLLRRLDARSYD